MRAITERRTASSPRSASSARVAYAAATALADTLNAKAVGEPIGSNCSIDIDSSMKSSVGCHLIVKETRSLLILCTLPKNYLLCSYSTSNELVERMASGVQISGGGAIKSATTP